METMSIFLKCRMLKRSRITSYAGLSKALHSYSSVSLFQRARAIEGKHVSEPGERLLVDVGLQRRGPAEQDHLGLGREKLADDVLRAAQDEVGGEGVELLCPHFALLRLLLARV